MTRVVIIDAASIRYSDNAYRGEGVDWFDVSYDEDNIEKVNAAIVAEVRDAGGIAEDVDRAGCC